MTTATSPYTVLNLRKGVSEEEIVQVQQGMSRDLSLDAPVTADSEAPLSDRMVLPGKPADEQLAEEEFQQALREKMTAFAETLDDRDRDIFSRRLVAESQETLREFGESEGISREAIRQRERKIVGRLKIFLRQELADFEGLEFLREEAAG